MKKNISSEGNQILSAVFPQISRSSSIFLFFSDLSCITFTRSLKCVLNMTSCCLIQVQRVKRQRKELPEPTTQSLHLVDKNLEKCKTFFKGIDVNIAPTITEEEEEEIGVPSPNSSISSLSGNKRNERGEIINCSEELEMEIERECSRSISDEEDGETSRKKLRLSKDQTVVLEASFKKHNTLNSKQKQALAKRLGLRPRQVEVWFQNRRARTKLKQTEVDFELLKRCCENLTEENRRLQKEVQELKALKLSPQFYMQMTPPTTLTMCPSCERVVGPPALSVLGPVSVDVRANQTILARQRLVPFNLWTASPVPHRPIKALRPS